MRNRNTPGVTKGRRAWQVWLAVITHKYGATTYIHRTRAGAIQSILGYVNENWKDAMKNRETPQDELDMLSQYFYTTEEYYEIDETEVLE